MIPHDKNARAHAPPQSAELPMLRECARVIREIDERIAYAEVLTAELRGVVRARFVVGRDADHPWPSSRVA